ncbi:MAG: HAMP domain-containing protein [Nitrospirae bacterium]|nr:MAG: HAMP domain-containing protein [Nitrospirota bacterium]
MKQRIIAFLSLLFIVFTTGAAISMLYIAYTTTELKKIITLHGIEILRQDLIIKIQNVEQDLLTVHTELGKNLDKIVLNVTDLDNAINNCRGCHHSPLITQKLGQIKSNIERFETSLSHYITASADADRIRAIKIEAYTTGAELMSVTSEMAFIANKRLQERTSKALTGVKSAQWILAVTLAVAFLIALWIAITLINNILRPINELIAVSQNITSGNLGYTTSYTDNTEFGSLADSINEMSLSLREGNEKVVQHMNRLAGLYKVTLPFHSVSNITEIFREVSSSVASLLDVEQCGLMLQDAAQQYIEHKHPAHGLSEQEVSSIRIPKKTVLELYYANNRRPLLINDPQAENFPRELLGPAAGNVRNLLVGWIRLQGELVGLLRLANKRDTDFSEESIRLIGIISNNISVALENTKLYEDLKAQMQELKETQEQLIQAAKLAAIGELASNVAHEINNPLTSIMGYAELIREETDLESIMKDIDIISKESIRARNIVQQLLEFARRRPLEVKEVAVNNLLKETVSLVRVQLKDARIKITEQYGNLPVIMGDPNQLKQVFLNILNNAVHSMTDGNRELSITSSTDNSAVHIAITDTGHGIPADVLPRIFEPFFTTKKEKGTGLGLSITYKIIQSHRGRIDVRSEIGKGTTFTIVLPVQPVANGLAHSRL